MNVAAASGVIVSLQPMDWLDHAAALGSGSRMLAMEGGVRWTTGEREGGAAQSRHGKQRSAMGLGG